MARKDWVNLTIRMPRELHEILRNIAYNSHISINQIMIETLAKYVAKTPRNPDDDYPHFISDEPEIRELLQIADDQITKQFIREMGLQPLEDTENDNA